MNRNNLIKPLKLSVFILLVLFVSSCLNDDDGRFSQFDTPYALVSIINASPEAPGVYFFADENQVNQSTLTYNQGNGYYRFFTGDRTISVEDTNGNQLASDQITVAANRYYSVFACNTADNMEILFLEDPLDYPNSGRAWVRFVHVVPDAPETDLLLDEEVVADALAFKDHSDFVEVNAGVYDLEVQLDADGTSVITEEGVSLIDGRIYTIFVSGTVASADFDLNVFRNY